MISLTCGTPPTLFWYLSQSNNNLMNILQYGNILQGNTQYGADPYCYIPSVRR